MTIQKGLGRGFASLIPTDLVDEEFDPTSLEDEKLSQFLNLPLDKISVDPDQPRKDFNPEALESLASSIKSNGVLQPIVVVRHENGYQIVAGERRYRAAKLAGLTKIPAIVRTLDAQNRLELSVIENAQREDLNAIELATAYAKLQTQFNLSPKEIGVRIGKSETSIRNTLRLLELPDFAKKAMAERNLPEAVMRPLIPLSEAEIEQLLPKIIDEGWTVKRVEDYFKAKKAKKPTSAAVIKASLNYDREQAFTKKFAARSVKITSKSITITFKNNKELEKLLNKL
ncbi:ParB/RepB/Spo0J family partition protein [Candidatus Saccharibacteria bacterium]|nr:ParB/RepB/Spo0J family partition protein [Candidatus Saccharibacteria bacterium]